VDGEENEDIVGLIILRWILERDVLLVWAGFVWLRI
jgi:hypothetical protein